MRPRALLRLGSGEHGRGDLAADTVSHPQGQFIAQRQLKAGVANASESVRLTSRVSGI